MTRAVPTVALAGGGAIPILGFGTWQIEGEAAYHAVRRALEVGYRHIDTATVYGNESQIGRAIADSGVPREELFVTTKLPGDRPGRAGATLEASLRALRTEYVDLWLVHWPPPPGALVEVWAEAAGLADLEAVRALGVSNYSIAQIDEIVAKTGVAPAVNQVRLSPFIYDASFVAASAARHVVVEGYSPFKASRLGHPLLVEIARRHGVTAAQVVLRWHIEHGIVVIPKSVTPDRIAENFEVFSFSLAAEEMAALDGLSAG